MTEKDRGMTLIEVSIALVILLIGVGFILNSDRVSFRYQHERQIRQQMVFYAAGQMEATVEGKESYTLNKETLPPFSDFQVNISQEPITGDAYEDEVVLEKVTVTVSLKDSPNKPKPIELISYRVRAGEGAEK